MQRNSTFDLLRVIATVEVVSFHCLGPINREHYLFGFGTFVAISVYLQATARETSWGTFARSKLSRLLLPWVFWGVLGVAADVLRVKSAGLPLAKALESYHPLYFNRIHLWYVPFACVALASIRFLAPRVPRSPSPLVYAGLLAAAGAAYVAPHMRGNYLNHVQPWPQWIMGSGSVLFALVLARALAPAAGQGMGPGADSGERRNFPVIAATLGLYAVLSLGLLRYAPHPPLVPIYTNGYGLGLLTFGLLVPRLSGGPIVREAIGVSYGVFLAHPLVTGILARFAWFDREDMFDGIVVVTLVTAALISGMRRTPLRVFT